MRTGRHGVDVKFSIACNLLPIREYYWGRTERPGTAERFGLIIAVAVVLDLVVDFQRKAAVLHTITVDIGDAAAEWQDLWGRIESTDAWTKCQRNGKTCGAA